MRASLRAPRGAGSSTAYTRGVAALIGRTRGIAAVVVTIALVGTGVATGVTPAWAAKKPVIPSQNQVDAANAAAQAKAAQIAQVEAQLAAANASLQKLNDQVEVVVEAYDGATVKLQAAELAQTQAQAELATARTAQANAHIQMNIFAADSYRGSGDLDKLSALVLSDSPSSFLTRADTLSAIARHEQSVINQVTATAQQQAAAEKAAETALSDQQAASAAAAKAKDSAIAAVNNQASQLLAIQQQQANLQAQLLVLKGTARNLADARALGLKLQAEAEAAARAAAKAAAARAAAAAAAAKRAAEQAAAARAAAAAAAAARAAVGVSTSSGGSNGSGSTGSSSTSGSSGSIGGTPVDVVPAGGTGQSISTAAQRQLAISFAESQIGVWYRWAGAGEIGPTMTSTGMQNVPGYDCSGLTMRAYEAAGIELGHYTGLQWDEGLHVSRAQLQPGDLVFFATNLADQSTIHHVGIYIGNGQMIDAPTTGQQVGIHNAFRPDYIGAVQP